MPEILAAAHWAGIQFLASSGGNFRKCPCALQPARPLHPAPLSQEESFTPHLALPPDRHDESLQSDIGHAVQHNSMALWQQQSSEAQPDCCCQLAALQEVYVGC